MNPESRWSRLARLSESAQRAMQARALARQVREELAAFSLAFRRALEGAGTTSHGIRGPQDLASLPTSTRRDLVAEGRSHLLTLDPRALRRSWSTARKLALGLGGRRVRAALPRSYRPALRLETRGRSAEPLAVWLTAFDIEVARELGRRHLELLRLSPAASRVLALVGGGTDLASWQVREALQAAAVPAAFARAPRGAYAAAALRAARALEPTALFGSPADLLRLARAARREGVLLGALELAVILHEPADLALRGRIAAELEAAGAPAPLHLAAAYGLAELRTLYVECPAPAAAPSGLHLHPDALLAEALEVGERGSELVVTPLLGHGTAVFRYRTGDRVPGPATWAPCPACGRNLPRIGPVTGRLDEDLELGGGARLDLAALRAALDGRAELLEWQLLVERRAGRPQGLVLRVATVAGTRMEELATELREILPAGAQLPPLTLAAHSEEEMLDFLAAPHEMLERRLLDPADL